MERVDEGAFQLPHVMQVVTEDGAGASHTTYLQCKVRCGAQAGGGVCGSASPIFFCLCLLQNVNDLYQWLSALRKASAPNPDKLVACHPGAFRSGRWTCCLQAERSGEVVGVPQAAPSAAAHRPRLPVSSNPPPPGCAVQPRARDLISLCLAILLWEAGLGIAHTSLVLLADTKLISSKCLMQVLFPTVLLCARCPEQRQSDLLKLDGDVVKGCSAVAESLVQRQGVIAPGMNPWSTTDLHPSSSRTLTTVLE